MKSGVLASLLARENKEIKSLVIGDVVVDLSENKLSIVVEGEAIKLVVDAMIRQPKAEVVIKEEVKAKEKVEVKEDLNVIKENEFKKASNGNSKGRSKAKAKESDKDSSPKG